MQGKTTGRNESEPSKRHRETEPGGINWESQGRESRACIQVAKADTYS